MTATKLLLSLALSAGGLAGLGVHLVLALDGTECLAPPPKCEQLMRRLEAKHRVINNLVEGRLTLFEAASCFRLLEAEPPGPTPWYSLTPAASEGENLCRQVILWAAGPVPTGEAARLRLRLEGKLEEHLRANGGAVILPAPHAGRDPNSHP